MVVLGVGAGLAHAASVGDSGLVARDLAAAVARVPAVWVLVALTLALYGLAGRRVTVAWAVVVGCVVVGQFGDLMALPRWVQDLSPYVHVSQLPGHRPDAPAVAVLLVVAAGLAALGLVAFRRRDVLAD
jgi:ABC-2 type transport system permease protein